MESTVNVTKKDIAQVADESTETISKKAEGRDLSLDLVKGLGILLMLYGHVRGPFYSFVSLFHMALFFIASGCLYANKNAENFKAVWQYSLRKLKHLYLPYVCYMIAFILLRNIFLDLNVYTDDPAFLEAEGLEEAYQVLFSKYSLTETITNVLKALLARADTQQVGGALWFLITLCELTILYNFIEYVLEKISKKYTMVLQTCVAILFLAVGYYCDLTDTSFGGLNKVFSCYILFQLGVLIKRYDIMRFLQKLWANILTIVLSFLILVFGYNTGKISIVSNQLENPVFFLVMSIAGWCLIYSIVLLLQRIPHTEPLQRGIAYLSRHSVPILALQFLSFKLVNALIVLLYDMEPYMIAAFPVLKESGAWWLLYLIVGIAVPLGLRWLAAQCKTGIVRLFSNRKGKQKMST